MRLYQDRHHQKVYNIQGKADSGRISPAKHSEQRGSTSNSESYETIHAESNESSSDASLN